MNCTAAISSASESSEWIMDGWTSSKAYFSFFSPSVFPLPDTARKKHVLLLLHKSSRPSLNSVTETRARRFIGILPCAAVYSKQLTVIFSAKITAYTQAKDAYKNRGLARVTLHFHISVPLNDIQGFNKKNKAWLLLKEHDLPWHVNYSIHLADSLS